MIEPAEITWDDSGIDAIIRDGPIRSAWSEFIEHTTSEQVGLRERAKELCRPRISAAQLARMAGLDRRTVYRFIEGVGTLRPGNFERLASAIDKLERGRL